jgi:hypothetical protein
VATATPAQGLPFGCRGDLQPVRSILATKCVRRTHLPLADRELAAWARSVVRDPQRHLATVRESEVVASLLAELEGQR